MSRGMALSRIGSGLALIALLYGGPHAYGFVTSGDKLDPCLTGTTKPHDVVVKLAWIPGPTQIEDLQRYGRYGGSGGELTNVLLLGVPPQNVDLLARLYWVNEVDPLDQC